MGIVTKDEQKILDLIREHGTPLQIAFGGKAAENYKRAAAALSHCGWQENIFYSYKTNPVPEVLKVLHQNGAGAEVISERELNLALDLGVSPDRIVFNGIYKSPQALKTAVENKIKSINIDNPAELDILDALSRQANEPISIGLRVRPSVGWQGQFGFKLSDGSAFKIAQRIKANGKLNFNTIHFHLGGSLNLKTYQRGVDQAVQFIKQIKDSVGITIKALDIGGGFPGPDMRILTLWEQGWLRLWDRPWPLPAADSDDGFRIMGDTAGYFNKARIKNGLNNLEMWTEPGRLITGDAQILAVKVVGLRKTGGKQYAIVDGGRVGAAGPLVGETRKVSVLGKSRGTENAYDIVGPTCMSWDRLFAGVRLPELEMGDILVIEGAGAYFVPMETEFSFARPKLVLAN